MNQKFIFITILCSVVGFSMGFSITKIYAKKLNTYNTSNLISRNTIEPVNTIAEVKSQENKDTPGIEDAPELTTEQTPIVPQKIISQKIEVTKENIDDCPSPTKTYDDYSYVDVGQVVFIPDISYIPSNLVKLNKNITKYPKTCLKKEAAESLLKMIDDAKKDNLIIKVSSAFRSYETQEFLLDRSIKSGNVNAIRRIAKPGHSEHQLGLAVDLTSPSVNNDSTTTKFENTKEYKWLKNNSYLYGFLESYPEGKEDITGYMYEAWHYRYVGIDNAKEIIKNNQTINEFFKDNKNN